MTSTEPAQLVQGGGGGGEESQGQASVTIRQMFDCNRFATYTDIFFLCFYFPIGICLFTIRLFIFIHVLLISNLFPNDSYIRSLIFRTIFFVLGLVIQEEEDFHLKNFKAQLVVSNRISDFDPLVVNLIYPCAFLSSSTFPPYINWLFGISKETIAQHKNDLTKVIQDSALPVLCFPESSRTNGRVGLFKFENWPFSCDLTSHLILIESTNPLFNVSISPLGASWHANIFWFLFLPVTIYNIRYLSSIEKNDNESIDEYAKRTQRKMASQANLYASNFDNNDKKEMMKRIRAERMLRSSQNRSNIASSSSSSSKSPVQSLDHMAIKVKEVLPQVPLAVIQSDIEITNNIDDTIERILNGNVPYTAEVAPESDSPQSDSSSSRSSGGPVGPAASSESGKLFYCGANSFGKSADDRAKSFQERKEQLFREARMRYIQKHNLANQ